MIKDIVIDHEFQDASFSGRGVVKKGEKTREEYFQSIARHFFKLRGAPFFLSSKELDLITGWEKMAIPLPIVLEGITKSFEKYRSRPGRKAKVLSLSFCNFEVLRAFEQYIERKVGVKKRIVEREAKAKMALAEAQKFLKAIPLQLSYLKDPYARAQKILSAALDEEELERIENKVEEVLCKNASEEDKDRVQRKLKAEYPNIDEEEFDRILNIKLVKILREKYKIPYISLYYY